MFETAMIDGRTGRGAVGFSGSLMLQVGVVGGLSVASLWMPVALPEPPGLEVTLPFPQFKSAVKVVSTSIERTSAVSVSERKFQFVPPTTRPLTASASMDDMVTGLPLVENSFKGMLGGHGDGVGTNLAPPTLPPPVKVEPPKAEPTRLVVGGDVLASKLIHRVQPVYPELARRVRVQGVVQLHGLITKEGRISQLRVISGHPLLVKAAVDAVSQWVYSPTLLNQKPVEVEAPIEVRFILAQ